MSRDAIRFGSLEGAERARLDAAAAPAGAGAGAGAGAHAVPMGAAALQAGMAAGNINIAAPGTEAMDLTESSLRSQDEHAAALRKIEASRRARLLAVPTDPQAVQMKLRALGQPICLFGEVPADRRERLRRVMAESDMDAEEVQMAASDAAAAAAGDAPATGGGAEHEKVKETIYYEAKEELKRARADIAAFSFDKAAKRLRAEAEEMCSSDAVQARDEAATALWSTVKTMRPAASQVGDVRPLHACAFSPDGGSIATGSWTGDVKLWETESCNLVGTIKAHEEKICGLAWRPRAASAAGPSGRRKRGGKGGAATDAAGGAADDGGVNLATGAADNECRLWKIDLSSREATAVSAAGPPVVRLAGHKGRIGRVAWHPSGRYVGTTSFDKTFRLWDVEAAKELVIQEGHAREVYPLAFHPDGSLAATGDLGGVGRLWDLRSGKSVMLLSGHVKQLLALDFSPDGFSVASGSEDNTSRVWDIRQRKSVYTIPGHARLVSCVRFAPHSGEYLATGSFDTTVRLWNARDFRPLGALNGHEGKVTGLDISMDETRLLTCSFDKTFKVWTHDEFA